MRKVIEEFIEFVGESELICHNASFDMAFINHACEEYGISKPDNKMTDTLELAKNKLRDIDSRKLGSLAHYFGIEETQSHRAACDCRLTAEIYKKLKGLT